VSERQYTDDMREISGFGGGYEAACRAMVLAGLAWFDAHPDADPHFKGMSNIFGLILEDNDQAKALTEAVLNAPVIADDGRHTLARHEATGAMHHAAINHIFAARRLGWDRYCAEMRRLHDDVDS
jgi:hypothetical protein